MLRRTSAAIFFHPHGRGSFFLIGQRQRANGPANQVHNVITNIGDRWSSHFRRSTVDVATLSSLCPSAPLLQIVFSFFSSQFVFSLFFLSDVSKSSAVSLHGALLANGRCSPRVAAHDHRPLALIRQRASTI